MSHARARTTRFGLVAVLVACVVNVLLPVGTTHAAAAYRSGRLDTFSALLASGSARELADVSSAKAGLDKQKAPIDALVTELAKQDADRSQQRQGIEAKLNERQRLRLQAYGDASEL